MLSQSSWLGRLMPAVSVAGWVETVMLFSPL
jgi:hypothetical protein